MNNKQKKILTFAAGAIILMLLFPPFVVVHKGAGVLASGYGFILSGIESENSLASTINVSQLFIQWVGVIIVSGVFFIINKD